MIEWLSHSWQVPDLCASCHDDWLRHTIENHRAGQSRLMYVVFECAMIPSVWEDQIEVGN